MTDHRNPKTSATSAPHVDLVPIRWFGGDAALATIEHMGVTSFFVVSTPGQGAPIAVGAPWVTR